MKKYKEWSPTQFDCKGLGIPDRQEWLVAPVCYTPECDDTLSKANFDATLKALGGESRSVEIHYFNHWATGFELILINPRAHKKVKIATDIENALENYPVVDDELFSQYESDQQWENLTGYGGKKDITDELESHFDIEDLELSENCLSYMVSDEWIEFSGENWPQLKLEHKWNNTKLSLEYLIKHDCTFTFSDIDSLYSIEHTDNLNASLMRALAASKHTYTLSDGTPIEIPNWSYPSPNQIELKQA
jgi:hypothetical protein